jgi:hypothetical protein
MAQSKPNKPLKSPNKQHIEEQNKQNKTKQNKYYTKCNTPHGKSNHQTNRNRNNGRIDREKR